VREELGRLGRFDLRLVRGVTGCQKTVLLQKLRDLGAQVVDLEGAADHKGSILGVNVDAPQPSQKLFESRLADEVARFDDSRPVFIEGESSLVGQRTVPSALLHSMRKAGSLLVEAPMDVRVDFIRQDYKYFEGRAVDELKERLQRLRQLRGGATVDRWLAQVEAGEWDVFVEDMLVSHYDPAYEDAARRDWEGTVLETVHIGAVGDAALEAAARELLERHDPAALAA
jgi:tRNA 2-selenouridine synthase